MKEQKRTNENEKNINEKENSAKQKDEEIINKRQEKIKHWLSDKYNLLFLLLIIFTVVVKLYYFSLTANQPTWWDEGDYLAIAKEIALPSSETPEWWGHFIGIRPPLMSLSWALFIKLGLSEALMRFVTEVIPSFLLVLFTYFLGASLFNKKIGLIAGYLTSIYWVIQFYGSRFMTDIPAMMFAIMSAYYFWEYYVKQSKPKGLYLAIFLGVLGFLTRFPTALVTFSILLYLLFIKKHKIFVDKHIWIAAVIGLITLIPYFVYSKLTLDNWFPAASFYGTENVTTYKSPAWLLFQMMPDLIKWPLIILAFIGLGYSLIQLLIAFDILWKRENNKINSHMFVFLWILLQIIYFVFIIKTGNDRWILLWMPPIFIYIGFALEKITDTVKKFIPYGALVILVIFIIFAGYTQLKHGDQLIKVKLDTYKEVKDTGLWLRENTPENAKILAASIVQNTYYAQRRSYDFSVGNEVAQRVENEVRDPQGRLIDITYKWIKNETELECKFVRIKPDYLILHIWEPEFTPDFMYTYPERNQNILTPVKAFYRGEQVTAAIYKFTGYPQINESKVNCTTVYERPITPGNKSLGKERLIIPS